jgi:hypothetical protein
MPETGTTAVTQSGADGAPAWLPAALRPRSEDEERAQRASRLVAQLGEHARSPLIEPRFVDGSRGLALALTGLAEMRANDFAATVAEELAERLARVLESAEAQLSSVLPALTASQGARRPRGSRKGGPTPSSPGQTRDR